MRTFLFTLVASMVAFTVNANAQELKCEPFENIVQAIRSERQTVLQGDAVTPFVDAYNAEPGLRITEKPSQVIVLTNAARGTAWAIFVHGDKSCYVLGMPLNVAQRLMAGA